MSTLKCFIIGLENQKFAIPMNTIKNVQWIDSDKIFSKDNYNAIIIDNQTIPIIDLAQALNI
jgi:chemotaxis protein histidine kinase CheA